MIFYFSATGNSKYAASRIAAETSDRIISIPDCIREGRSEFTLKSGEDVGIVSPVYFWGLPTVVRDFLKALSLKSEGSHYIYFIATYGTTSGQIGSMTNAFMKQKGFPLDARFSIKMPDNWTPIFDLSDKEMVKETNRNAEPQIDQIIHTIKSRGKGDFMRNKIPMTAVRIFYPVYGILRKTKRLTVEESCTGCGLCAKNCPVNAIEIQNGKPVWLKERCALCLGCLHRCPQFSIQYGKKTKKHGQYTHPGVSL